MRLVVAMDPTGVIGVNGEIPWYYPRDLQRFKRLTMGGALIMGRKTWESLPGPLPGRRTIVLSSQDVPKAHAVCKTIDEALTVACSIPSACVWVCGGGSIYKAFLESHYADIDEVDVTLVPKMALGPHHLLAKTLDIVRFPVNLLEKRFTLRGVVPNAYDSRLHHYTYVRKSRG